MLTMTLTRHGGWTTKFECAVCERTATRVDGWQALVPAAEAEPVVVCANPECGAEVRRDWPNTVWAALPLLSLVTDLALQYGPPRRSWRCRICTDLARRSEIDHALASGVPQRTVAERFNLSKGLVDRHALAHLPVLAVIAAGRS